MEVPTRLTGPLSRREFLHAAGRTGLGALVLSAGGGILPAVAGQAREIHLEARELVWELAPGRRIRARNCAG